MDIITKVPYGWRFHDSPRCHSITLEGCNSYTMEKKIKKSKRGPLKNARTKLRKFAAQFRELHKAVCARIDAIDAEIDEIREVQNIATISNWQVYH